MTLRMLTALQRPIFQRVIARVAPGTDLPKLSQALEQDRRVPLQVLSEREYLGKQTSMLGGVLAFLAGFWPSASRGRRSSRPSSWSRV